jgi:UDP-2,3-diacylglucosamine pyrophosphatase LpxH
MKYLLRWTILFFLLFVGCNTKTDAPPSGLTKSVLSYPDTRFLVASDLHFYDTSLGIEGKAMQKYLDEDRKLLVLSEEIIGTAIAKMAMEEADFLLVPGDLTKDGERICHEGVARYLKTLTDAGKKVFVVPGNHDINNPGSVRFVGDNTEPVPSIDPVAFKQIYKEFGYGQAIAQDPDSLSYVAEPVPGLLLLALDSNRYKENRPDRHSITDGVFSKLTLSWIKTQLKAARGSKKPMIVMLHHGIMEHYPANEKFYDQYLIDDYEDFATLLASYGVRMVFTGHFHAQDITSKTIPLKENKNKAHRIFDIETGSLATAPCPYRVVNIGDNQAKISSKFITAIPSMGEGFKEYADTYLFETTRKLTNATLARYKVSPDQMNLINSQVATAYSTHLNGDEASPGTSIDTQGFGTWLKFIAWMQEDLLEGWHTDLAPQDNTLAIDLDTGMVQ